MDQALEALADVVVRPLSGDVGDDLAQTESKELLYIRNQFNEANRDFLKLLETGRVVLAEKSKDLWAAWALVGGLLWSKQYDQTEGFVVSCKVVRGLCEQFWDKLFPESRGLKNTLLTQIAKWWNTFIVRCSEGASRTLLKEAHDELTALQASLLKAIDGATDAEKQKVLPFLGTLSQVVRALAGIVAPESVQSTSAPEGNGRPESPTAGGAAAARPADEAQRNAGSLDQAFEHALARLREGATDAGLREFQETLKSFGELAAQVRGRVLLGELYLRAGLPLHAKRVLQYTHDEVEKIKLSDWDPRLCSRLWSNLIQANLRVKEEKPNEKLLQEIFGSLCRIDPATAATLEPIKNT